MGKWLRKLFLVIFFISWRVAEAQNQSAIIADFRRVVGEPDSTGAVTGAIARTWLNMGLREFANYGVLQRETTYVAKAGSDTLFLPIDFLYPKTVKKTLFQKKSYRVPLQDSGLNAFTRMDTVVLSTARPDTTLAADVKRIEFCYKKSAADKVIRPLIQVSQDSLEVVGRALVTRTLSPKYLSERLDTVILSTARPDTTLKTDVFSVLYAYKKSASDKAVRPLIQVSADSMEKVGRALVTRQLPGSFLSERLDTLVPSKTTPINILRTDVFDIHGAFRKDPATGQIYPMVKIPIDSLNRVGTDPTNYYYFSGQPNPRLVLGKQKSSTDTVYLEVVVASDYFTFLGQPTPKIVLGKIPATSDTLFCKVAVASDFFTFMGQPTPRIVLGKIPATADTLFCDVLAASDFFTFIPLPYPKLIMGKIPATADSCFCKVQALLPNYSFVDTGLIATAGRGYLKFFPPIVTADTIVLDYFATTDTLASQEAGSTNAITNMDINLRGALIDYMASRYYFKQSMMNEYKETDMHWREVMSRWALMRGFPVVAPSK